MGLGALGLLAFPITNGFLTRYIAYRFWCDTRSNALGFTAGGDTCRAVLPGAAVFWALDLALREFAPDIADGVSRSLACVMTNRLIADWRASCWALWVITLPSTLGMTIRLLFPAEGHRGGESKAKSKGDNELHFVSF